MNASTIPNIHISKTKVKNGIIYRGSALVDLPCWTGYFLNENPKAVITNGQIILGIENSSDNNDGFSTSQAQTNAYHYLLENQKSVKNNILQELKEKFPSFLSDEYASYDRVDFPKLSDLTTEFDFRNYIRPSSVNIEKDAKDNVAYLTWHFNCLWDSEHGFEVIVHKERVLEIAPQADLFKICEDNGTDQEVNQSLDEYLKKMKEDKKWWKFW
jgi:hypothetical protein